MTDQETLISVLEEARGLLIQYIAPGPRDPRATIHSLSQVLCQPGLTEVIERLKAGYGLRVVK